VGARAADARRVCFVGLTVLWSLGAAEQGMVPLRPVFVEVGLGERVACAGDGCRKCVGGLPVGALRLARGARSAVFPGYGS